MYVAPSGWRGFKYILMKTKKFRVVVAPGVGRDALVESLLVQIMYVIHASALKNKDEFCLETAFSALTNSFYSLAIHHKVDPIEFMKLMAEIGSCYLSKYDSVKSNVPDENE